MCDERQAGMFFYKSFIFPAAPKMRMLFHSTRIKPAGAASTRSRNRRWGIVACRYSYFSVVKAVE